ncbi:MAG: amidohydrolase family protein [Natronincolaceae bacterium]|jgi:predicted TIM-barrel fold metal-dependent hydrolase|nr:amidohydrolase family protein [Bacillota bacterium]NLK90652.1 amidohydrolase [Clostridiales bacterium]
MKIDFHVHVTPPDIIKDWKKIAEKELYFKLLSESPVNKFADAEDIVAELDSSNVDKAVVFGFAFKDMGLCRYANDYVADAIKRFPDKLIGYMILTPTSDEITKEIDRCIDMGLTGIGELMPYGQGFNIDDQKEMSNLSNACIERDLPVIIHTNEAVGHHYCGKTDTTAVKAGALAHNYPDLKVIFAHWGGGLLFYELMPEIRKQNKNVYYDTAASPFLYDKKIYKVAKEIGILDKVLFGSDYPLISMKRYIKDVADTGLSESDQALVNGLNAKALLKL